MCCGATGPAPPAFPGTPSHPAGVPVPQALPGWRGVERALNSACPKGFEPMFLPLCLSPAALWLQLHQRVYCTLLSGCEWSRGPLCRGEGKPEPSPPLIDVICGGNRTITSQAWYQAMLLLGSLQQAGSLPLVQGRVMPQRWVQKVRSRGNGFLKPPRWGNEQLWLLPDFLPS